MPQIPTTAKQLIEAAFARSTASDAGKLAVDGEMIAHLNRKYQSTFARYSTQSGDNAVARSTVTWASNPATAALPVDIVDIVKLETASGGRLYLIPVQERDRTWHLSPACFRQGNVLASRGATAGTYGPLADPIAGDISTIWHKDSPAALTTLADTLDPRFPARFEGLLITDLALYLSVKDEGRSPTQMQAIRDELAREEAAFSLLIGESNTAKESAQPHVGGVAA